MLGVVLVTVGFVLFHNAWFGLFGKVKEEKAGKTLSVVNFLGGAVIVLAAIFVLRTPDCAFEKKFGKLTAIVCLLTTFYTGWIPGIMMIAGWW